MTTTICNTILAFHRAVRADRRSGRVHRRRRSEPASLRDRDVLHRWRGRVLRGEEAESFVSISSTGFSLWGLVIGRLRCAESRSHWLKLVSPKAYRLKPVFIKGHRLSLFH